MLRCHLEVKNIMRLRLLNVLFSEEYRDSCTETGFNSTKADIDAKK